MATLASFLVVIVAGQQSLWRQDATNRSFAHDTETVGNHLSRGYRPGRVAPALVDRLRNVFPPDIAQVIRPRKQPPAEIGLNRIHLQYLNAKLQKRVTFSDELLVS